MLGVTGIEGSFVREVIARSLVYVIVEIAYSATCFLASMFIRHLGASIGVNLGLLLMSNVVAQILFNFDWAPSVLRFTPVGQTMLMLADVETGNIAAALVASVIGIAAALALSYVKFGREELK